jgi:phage terminase large subunit-like protein
MATTSRKHILGSSKPRVETTPLKGRSLGPVVAELMESLGEPLLEWQKHLLDQGLQINDLGQYRRKTNTIVVARQNGKTSAVRALLLASLFIFNTKRIGIIAQDRKQSIETKDWLVEVIMNTPWMLSRLKKDNRSHGEERIEVWCEHYPESCKAPCNRVRRLDVISATPRAARGKSIDLLYIDELREIGSAVWAAAEPTMRARRNAQLWTSSNAGDDTSEVLNTLRATALGNKSERFGYWEWSASPDKRPTDHKGWAQANPSLGHLFGIDSLEDSFARSSIDEWETEALCRWRVALDSPWNMEVFDGGLTKGLALDSRYPTYMGLDLTFNRQEAYLVTVQVAPDGLNTFLHRWVKETPINEMELASEIAKIAREYKPRQISFDPATAGFVAPHLQRAGLRINPTGWSTAGFATLCDITMSAMNSGRIKHLGQEDLRKHLIACQRRPASDGGWRIARRAAQSPISAAVAFVLAVGGAEQPKVQVTSSIA